MRLIAAFLLLIAGPAFAQRPEDGPSADILARVAPAVLRVTASGCTGATPARSASGFAYQRPGQVVTALHVVAGCSTISVGYQGLGDKPATIARVLRDADLALLDVAGAPSVPPLDITDRAGQVNETVDVYGYALGQATRENRRLHVTDANRTTARLRDAVNDALRQELAANGFPSLDIAIVRVDGNLLPGHSGAPVIDYQGRVIAIGSGGMERGTVGVGWAVRASYVAQLLTAAAATPALVTNLRSAGFAYAPAAGSTAAQATRCGELNFVKTRQRRLEELVATADDPVGFYQLAQTTGQPPQTFANIPYDVWTETSSGVGVAIPQGVALQPAGQDCRAVLEPNVIEMRIGSNALPPPAPGDPLSLARWGNVMQPASVAFEQRVAQEFLPWLQIDPRYSYMMPQTRPTLMVNRKFFGGQAPGHPLPHAIFESLLATPRAFVGVAVINRAWAAPQFQPPQRYWAWLSAGFGTHLSTAPAATQ
jgi:S1-C subfamily serine protease